MFYVSDGKVYVREGDHFRNVGFTAKDKVITRRELESTSVVMGTVVVDTLDNPVALTKFNLSEKNPIPVIKKSRKKSEEPAE